MFINYKSIVKSRETRRKLLRLFDWVPDSVMVQLQYWIKMGKRLQLDCPQSYTEKLQWMKLFYKDPLMARCANKLEVRSYVSERGYEGILVPLIGSIKHADEIDFDALPERFVLKDSLGGGGNEVIICRDRALFNERDAIEAMSVWTSASRHSKHPGREWVYDTDVDSNIVIEELITADDGISAPMEFKFICFYGKPIVLYVMADRVLGVGETAGIFRAFDFKQLDAWLAANRRLTRHVERPNCYEQMLEAARILSAPFPEARIDLYYLGENKGFMFSEITFFDGSGYFHYDPDSFDYELGKEFILPKPYLPAQSG